MYLPRHFEQTDPEALHALMQAHPLATLVRHAPDGLTADHLPLRYDAATRLLHGHVARANPLWREAADGAVLAIFQGPQAYISPSGYPSKALTHKVVPTWNYTVVHAHGTLRARDDAGWLHRFVSELTQAHEAARQQPWAVSDAPDDYVQQTLRAIVGIEIEVTRLVGKWKVSQNRSAEDRDGAAAALAAGDEQARAMAAMMRG
jgi:transcriptional regulator